MKDFFRFLISKVFLINLAISIVVVVVVIWGTFAFLDIYTRHGETVTVPNFMGFKIVELDKFVEGKQVSYVINDSIYDLEKEKGTVVEQHPHAESQVKEDRIIYLTVNAKLPETVALPNLTDVTLRQAIARLETYGLKVGKLNYKPNQCVNCVLGLQFEGKDVESGFRIEKGSVIDLILGRGESGELVHVPWLVGLTKEEAEMLLKAKSLNIGVEIYEENIETVEDSIAARIYKQAPAYYREAMINLGKSIDLYFTNDSSLLPTTIPDSLVFTGDSI